MREVPVLWPHTHTAQVISLHPRSGGLDALLQINRAIRQTPIYRHTRAHTAHVMRDMDIAYFIDSVNFWINRQFYFSDQCAT